jgi:hypothetical protein
MKFQIAEFRLQIAVAIKTLSQTLAADPQFRDLP